MRTLKLAILVTAMAAIPIAGGTADGQTLARTGGYGHGGMFGLAVDGATAYVGNGHYLQRIDVSNPEAPVLLSELEMPGLPLVIRRAETADYVYVQTPNAGFRIIDVSDPVGMEEVDSYDLYGGMATGMAMSGETAVITTTEGVEILGVYDYNNPIGRNNFALNGAIDVEAKGDAAYIFDADGFRVMEITDPDHPVLGDPIPFLPVSNGSDPGDMCIDGNRLYMLCEDGLRAIDITDPLHPDTLGVIHTGFVGTAIGAGNGFVYVSDWQGVNVFDFTTPAQPIWRWHYSWNRMGHHSGGFVVHGTTAYYADTFHGLAILDVTDPMTITQSGIYEAPGSFDRVVRDGDLAVLGGYPRVYLFDVSDPAAPVLSGALPAGLDSENMKAMLLRNDQLYLLWNDGLEVFNVADPASPAEVFDYVPIATMNAMTFIDAEGSLVVSSGNDLLFFDVGVSGSISLEKTVEIATWADRLLVRDDYLFAEGWGTVDAYPLSGLVAGSGTIVPCGTVNLPGPQSLPGGFVLEPVENWIYLGRNAGQIEVISIADPCALEIVGGTTFMPTVTGLARCRSEQDGPGLLVLNTYDTGRSFVTLMDFSDPTTPVEYAVDDELMLASDMALWESELIVTVGPLGFQVLDTAPYTPVVLASFTAERRDNEVVVRWELGQADARSGFNVYRQEGDGEPVRLNDSPLYGDGVFSFVDPEAPVGEVRYRLEELDGAGGRRWLGSVTVAPRDVARGRPVLHPNAPNPFAPRTTIAFDLPAAGRASVAVYDVTGRLVTVLLDGPQPAGRREVEWDGRDGAGRPASSGIYFIELRAAGEVQRRKVTLAR